MTLWELRESFEKAMPWWIVLVAPALALAVLILNPILFVFNKLRRKNLP